MPGEMKAFGYYCYGYYYTTDFPSFPLRMAGFEKSETERTLVEKCMCVVFATSVICFADFSYFLVREMVIVFHVSNHEGGG
jgi:hypothetical protein